MSSIHGCRREEKRAALRLLLLLVTLAITTQLASATTIIPMTDRELYERADVVVHGIVVSSDVTVDEMGRPEMLTIISPLEVLKGRISGSLVLHQLGGTLPDGRFLKIWGQPEYEEGHEVVVFAIARPQGEYQTAELLLGKFEIQGDAHGVLFAVPAHSVGDHPGVAFLHVERARLGVSSIDGDTPEIDRDFFKPGGPRELQDFLRYLRAGAPGTCPRAVRPVGLLTSVKHPEVVTPRLAPEWGNISNALYRWNNNATATWTIVNTANITGGGTTEAINALASWTNNPNSTINYTAGSGSSNTIDLNATDVCGQSGCLSGAGVIGCGGPRGSGSHTWRGDTYWTITGGFAQLRSYCTFNGYGSVTTQAVLTHELGHTLGLGHSDQNVSSHDACRGDESVAQMRSSVQGFTALGTDDQDAIRWLYGDGLNSCSATPTVSSLTASPTLPSPVGTAITWTAAATGGVAPLQYAFYLYTAATNSWSLPKPYSTSNTWSWTPSQSGQYAVQVWVKNNGSTAAYDAWMGSGSFNIGTSTPPTVTSLTASPTLPRPVGTAITWTATATGGTAPLQYEFLLYSAASGTWSVARAYSTSYTWSWTPSQAGQYAVQVWVRNNGSAASYDAWTGSSLFNILP